MGGPPADRSAEAATRPRILVADDNPDVRAYMARALEPELSVVSVEDGLQAWEVLQRQRFDAVVSDVVMPELDGVSLAARIKDSADLADVPVILITARGGSESIAVGLDAGADDYIVKPFALEELRARVRAALRMAHLQRELRARAREAGRAEVATGALHSIGNAVTSVSVAIGVLRNLADRSRVEVLEKLAALLADECRDEAAFAAFAANDPRGRRLPQMIATLSEQLTAERARIREELDGLARRLDQVTALLASQQNVAHPVTERALTELPELLHEAVRLAMLASAGVRVEHHHESVPAIALDPRKLLLILTHLLANAKDALLEAAVTGRGIVRIRTRVEGGAAIIEISDDGVGILGTALPRIFEQGFTTKPGGRGLGLHLSALAAAELGGSLSGKSDGPGRGATFTLILPLERASHG